MTLVTVRTYREPINAVLAQARLADEGIAAFVADQHLIGVQWLYSTAIGGAKLEVDEDDVARASAILDEDRSDDLVSIPESASALADGARCPRCGSFKVVPSVARRRWAALSLLIGFPIVAGRRRWICRTCEHDWQRQPARIAKTAPATRQAEARVYERNRAPIAWSFMLVILGLGLLHFFERAIRSSTP